MTIGLRVAGILAREAARAAAFPWRLALHAFAHESWKARTEAALAAPPTSCDAALRRFLSAYPPVRKERPHVFLSAGETSGETHALEMLRAVERAGLRPRWTAFGGRLLAAAGAEVLFPLAEQAIMGVRGVFAELPDILRAQAAYLRLLEQDPPDLVVLVDYPGLHLVMGRAARRAGVPALHYIAPQYWAWAPWRARRYRACVDATLAILPFEPAYFEGLGIPCAYVGHPLLDHLHAHPPRAERVAELRRTRTLCLLPGSRGREIRRHLPAMVRVARTVKARDPATRVVLPHRDPDRLRLAREILAADGADLVEVRPDEVAECLAGAHVVLAKSGTGALEACLHGAPTVVVYALDSRILHALSRRLFEAPWIGVPNLVAGRLVVPEHLFLYDAGWPDVERSVHALWEDGDARRTCLQGIEFLRSRLGAPGASDRAARWVLARCGHEPEPLEAMAP